MSGIEKAEKLSAASGRRSEIQKANSTCLLPIKVKDIQLIRWKKRRGSTHSTSNHQNKRHSFAMSFIVYKRWLENNGIKFRGAYDQREIQKIRKNSLVEKRTVPISRKENRPKFHQFSSIKCDICLKNLHFYFIICQ